MKGLGLLRHESTMSISRSLELRAVPKVEVDDALDLAEVYRLHAPTVMRWATRLSRDPADASDITQEVFCVVQRRLMWFRPRAAKLETWLFRITENVVRSHRRKQRLTAFLFGEREIPEVDDGRATAPELLSSQQDIQQVNRVLNGLSEADRTLLVLFEIEGYSGQEVAELMSLKPDVIWVRLHRARQRFLERINTLENEASS